MKISVFTSDKDALTKCFKVVDGAIEKTTQAILYSGTVETRDATTPAELLALLEELTPLQAVATGVLNEGTWAEITTLGQIAKITRLGKGVGSKIARTKENFHYPKAPGWLLWDYDTDGMPSEVQDRITALGGPLAALISIWPEAAASPYVIRASSSGGVSAPGLPERQSDGLHGFFLIEDVSRSKEALGVLQARAWTAGLAWSELNSSGQIKAKSLVDTTVGTPERLVFEAPPILIYPVTKTPKPAILSDGVEPVPVPTIDAATSAEAADAKAKAERAIRPEAKRAEDAWIERHAQEDAQKTGRSINEARRAVEKMRESATLPDDHMLLLLDGSSVRVGDVLDKQDYWDRKAVADPIQGLSKNKTSAGLLLRPSPDRPDMQPCLVSHAGGKTTVYRFERYERAGLSDHPASAVPIFDAWELARVDISDKRESGLIQALGRVTDPAEAAAVAWSVAARQSITCPVRRSLGDVRAFLDRHLPPLMAHPTTLDGIMHRLAARR